MGNTDSIMPGNGFLNTLRRLCDEYGIVMIMDEVKTGLRIGAWLKGARLRGAAMDHG
ncbi:MAG: aminotransferase class III-fold pyridoxal phosphate-dependent enzyme [Spirochaetaceae bacterium]|nr:MAG: aminotransferase class III-fold pyridoxal phosphate-dependent enzyme [Spirochaetaceae bacterium]